MMTTKIDPGDAGTIKRQIVRSVTIAILIMAAVGALGYVSSRAYVLKQAEKNITNLLLSHKGIHHYVQNIMLPAYSGYQKRGEIPPTFYAPELLSSSYIVRNQHTFYNQERKAAGLPELYYKLAANNPRNPINKADALEARLIAMFNDNRELKSYREIIEVDGKKNLYIAIPFLKNEARCMRCHGKRESAPHELQERYPGQGGFNERLGEIRAITSIRSPLEGEFLTIDIIMAVVVAGGMTLGGLFLFNTRLRSLVRQRTVALEEEIRVRARAEEAVRHANTELSAKNKDLEQILYVASHDLRSPLVNVQGFSKELARDFAEVVSILEREGVPPHLKEELRPLIQEEIPQSLNFIQNSVSKMDQLLNGLLRISRLGRAAITITTLEMNTIMAQVVADHEFLLQQHGVTVTVEPLPPCRGDQMQVDQVFANLVGNAIKFRHPERPGHIRITGQVSAGQAVYCVADNGIGIAPGHQAKVFDIFHKLAPESEGQGLGLNIVRKILDRLDGKVWIESEPDLYCKFFVALPKAENKNTGGGGR